MYHEGTTSALQRGWWSAPVAYPASLFWEGGSTNSVEDRENRDLGGGSPLVRGSGGSCNLVQEISFDIANFS